jgi:threonine synthase
MIIKPVKTTSCLIDLSCTICGERFSPHQIQSYCIKCNAPLQANYDLKFIKNKLDREDIRQRSRGMWRWSELLPVYDGNNIISLGEGDTPLIHLGTIGREFGLSNLYLKEEGQNPTGSFKARGLSAAISKAKELGIEKVVIPSAGNAGGALAAYAARAGIDSLIYMPKNTPAANIAECMVTGAKVELIDGLITDAGKYAQEVAKSQGWFNMSTFKEPYRVEGKKIMGYEIAENFSWKLPDAIIYPTGGGTGLVGMWKAFIELEALGWLESRKKPKMIAIQAQGCMPIVKAFRSGKPGCDFWEDAYSIASGLCVPLSFADKLTLKNIRESHGLAISVSDDEILESRQQLAQKEGIFTCPEGAATLAGLGKLKEQGIFHNEEVIIIFNTGSGLKYIDA